MATITTNQTSFVIIPESVAWNHKDLLGLMLRHPSRKEVILRVLLKTEQLAYGTFSVSTQDNLTLTVALSNRLNQDSLTFPWRDIEHVQIVDPLDIVHLLSELSCYERDAPRELDLNDSPVPARIYELPTV